MTQPDSDEEIQLQQTLDRLNITPQQLFTRHTSPALSTPDLFEPKLQRAGDPEPFADARAWRVNPDTLNNRLQAKFFPVAPADPIKYGFCYKLTHQGRTLFKDKANAARLAVRGFSIGGLVFPAVPHISWNYNVETNLASISKLITAIAMDRLLREQDVDLDEPVKAFLPAYWTFHPSTDGITFRHLLRHESGLGGGYCNSGAGDYPTARAEMGRRMAGTLGTFAYKNVNYALLRVTFPIVAKALGRDFSIGALTEAIWDLASATHYRDYVNDRIFGTANIGPFDFKAGPDVARAYPTSPVPPGSFVGDATNEAGSTGWHLTLDELMKAMTEFRHGGRIMSRRKAQQLLQNGFGVNESLNTNAGMIFAKRGRYVNGDDTLDTAFYFIPGNLELGVFINSGPGSGEFQASYNDDIMGHIAASVEEVI